MVLGADDVLAGVSKTSGAAVTAPPVEGVLARIDEALAEGLCQMLDPAEVLVISQPLPCDQGVERMMKIVVPLRVEASASEFAWEQEAGVVQVAFRDQIEPPIHPFGLPVRGRC